MSSKDDIVASMSIIEKHYYTPVSGCESSSIFYFERFVVYDSHFSRIIKIEQFVMASGESEIVCYQVDTRVVVKVFFPAISDLVDTTSSKALSQEDAT